MVIALNKADKLSKDDPSYSTVQRQSSDHKPRFGPQGILSEGVPVSALRKTGMDEMLKEVEAILYERMVPIRVRLPYKAGDLMALFRREGTVDVEVPDEHAVVMTGRIPGRLLDTFNPYVADIAGVRRQ